MKCPPAARFALYAETGDGKFAGAAIAQTPKQADPVFHPVVTLRSTVKVARVLKRKDGTVLNAKKVTIEPVVGVDQIVFRRREATTDAAGRIEISGVVPGLAYHLAEVFGPPGGIGVGAVVPGQYYDETLELAPKQP